MNLKSVKKSAIGGIRKQNLFTWESRPATSADDGTGFFAVVGGYDVIVRERTTRKPVTGGMVVAASERELRMKVEGMLERFTKAWVAQSVSEKKRNMAIAADTARAMGW